MAEFLKIIVKPSEEEDPDKWMVDMEFFLSNGIPPEEMGREERKRFGVCARAYCLFHGNLYHKAADGICRRVVAQMSKRRYYGMHIAES